MIERFILVTILITLLSCEKDSREKDNLTYDFRLDAELVKQLNTDSYDTLVLASGSYILDAYLWRDFQPISPPDGKPMFSINWLINIDSLEIPDQLDLIKQYFIHEDSVWIASYENIQRRPQPIYKIEKFSSGGPKWGPNIYVDVIAQLYDSLTYKVYFLRCRNKFVSRTD